MGQKKAVLIGLLYPDTPNQLNGCVNDVTRMCQCLIDRFGFKEEDMTILIDTNPDFVMPTGANIRRALDELVQSASSGDTLFVFYSGHGSRMPAKAEDEDETGYDECIVPSDWNLIVDDDFRELACKVPDGCRLTIVSDSCCSGGLLGDAKEQIGDGTFVNNDVNNNHNLEVVAQDEQRKDGYVVKSRSISVSGLIHMLKRHTGNKDINVGNIRSTIFDTFGEDASPKVKKFVNILRQKVKGRKTGEETKAGASFMSVVSLAVELEKQKLDNNPAIEDCGSTKHKVPKNGTLLSGCQTYQTSEDVKAPDGACYGVFTNAILEVLDQSDGEISNVELVLKIRELLTEQGHPQQPGLYCTDDYVYAPFIC